MNLDIVINIIMFICHSYYYSEVRDGSKRFRCTVKVVDKRIQVSAVARTLKLSQKAAARRALQILRRKESASM